jgi:poly(3-hydroxybutyrate) depolymerase
MSSTVRRSVARFVMIGLCLTLAPRAWAACDGAPAPAGAQTLEVAGAQRAFVVRLPAPYDGRTPAPVVLAFHPFGMNAQYMQARAPIGRAWPEAIAVYPEGLGRPGSAAPSWQGRPGELADRDVAFFDAVAGAAIAAGRLSCVPEASKPIILGHGVRDTTIDYATGLEAARAWARVNRCTAPPRAGAPGCVGGDQCGAATTFCTHPGGHEYDPAFTRAAVEFFKAVPR